MVLPFILCAQASLKNVAQKSTQCFAYHITAAAAEKYIKLDSIDVDAYQTQTPAAIFDADSVDETKLAKGLYVVIWVSGDDVRAYTTGVTNLIAYPINNRHGLQLLVRDKQGNFINDAHVWVNDKEAVFNSFAQSYCVQQKKPDGAMVKIYAPGDTTYITLTADDEGNYKTILQQRWQNFTRTKLIRMISWLPRTIGQLFKEGHAYKANNIGAAGTMVFNQPKYKQTDTVKFKAYIFSKRWRQYNKAVHISLEYYANGQQHKQLINIIKPSSPGSYIAQFPLSDTLPNDVNYTVNLTTKNGKRIIAKNFKLEDYVLDEVANYNIRSAQETYYPADTMRFFGSAKDAAGLPLLDASAKLILTTDDIHTFYKDSMYVPDTLFAQKKTLLAQGETEFDVPATILPDAGVSIKATLTFTNSNNELQDKNLTIHYSPGHRELVAEIKNDTVYAEYRVNGISAEQIGKVVIGGRIDENTPVKFPFKAKIDPLAEEYTFLINEKDGGKDSAEIRVGAKSGLVSLLRISKGDTLGFALENPYKIPISYTVFDGNAIKAQGKSSDAAITWQTNKATARKMYTVKWQYWWAGEEEFGEQTIGVLHKLLNINVSGAAAVFPGQKDTLSVGVTDYHNKPVKNVNLTALSYNSQFKKDIRVPDPPYLAKYRLKPVLQRDKFETDDAYMSSHYPLGKHTGWVKAFGLDTMAYYQMLFPTNGYVDKPTPVTGFSTQLSVNAVSHGQKQQVYMLYINRQLVYYKGVTEAMPYAFETFGGYVQIGMRLYNKFITIDSIYTQPGYKHDFVFDIDKLPPNSKVDIVNNYFSEEEISKLESSIMQVDNNVETNYSYIWEGAKTIHLASAAKHLIGPFATGDSLHLFAPGNFDIHFRFEPGYEYNISKQILRLEKKAIFPLRKDKYYLPVIAKPVWVLGDTIAPHPVIQYPPKAYPQQYFLNFTYNNYYYNQAGKGKLQLTVAKDTTLRYVVLYANGHSASTKILNGNIRTVNNIDSGFYTLLLVDEHNNAMQIDSINIQPSATFCIKTSKGHYYNGNYLLARLFNEAAEARLNPTNEAAKNNAATNNDTWQSLPTYSKGKATITGKVVDKKGGLAIAYATVMIKGTKTATATDRDGNFAFYNIKEGRCVLVISSVGFETKEMIIEVLEMEPKILRVPLNLSSQHLDEIVVVGYGSAKKMELTGSVSVISGKELTSTVRSLKGNVLGVQVSGEPGSGASTALRGISSMHGVGTPLFVVDGILYHEMPANVTADMISNITVLKGMEAVALYGAEAANGVLVVTTKTNTLRQQFRDYAFWQPALFTDEHGQAKFVVTYPDNSTGWQTYVLGMDKHRHMGKAVSFVQSYKPLMAELSMPQFLLEGDSAQPVGKALNYTGDVYNATTSFTVKGIQAGQDLITLRPKASVVKQYAMAAPPGDTLKAAFSLQTTTGFKDGEERKIPVFKRGTEETTGSFWVLKNDTSITFSPKNNGSPVELYAQNNTLDILLDEVEHLKNYPYYCMEQTGSKLRGLLMKKKIYETLHKPFTDDNTINWLVQKLQKAQLYSGGWGWWENGNADVNITAYVVKALLPMRDNPMVETGIRNGLLYLQNELTTMGSDQLLASLLAMGEAHHVIDYKPWLEKIHFDSLNQQQQWQYVRIKQLLNQEHAKELEWLLSKAVPGMLGSLHWGTDNYRWYSDANATTTLAFEVLQQEKGHDTELDGIIQYFLAERKQGHWVNTVTSASVVSATLPYLLAQNGHFQQPAVVSFSGDSVFSISQFPYKTVIKNPARQLSLTKAGGGLVYLTAYQHFFNAQPQPVTSNFDIQTWFEKNGNKVAYLTAGEKVTMVAQVNVLKEAEYVMMEVPIPAGCLYADKNQSDWQVHKEFMKNKAVLFAEHLSVGIHTFSIDLESRYNGAYTLNPAKASLMYYPSFYGRNEIRVVQVK